jgi:hypothetical protein
MWTPLLLLCYVDSTDCAIPVAPVYWSEQECVAALEYALDNSQLLEGVMVLSYTCHNWGVES